MSPPVEWTLATSPWKGAVREPCWALQDTGDEVAGPSLVPVPLPLSWVSGQRHLADFGVYFWTLQLPLLLVHNSLGVVTAPSVRIDRC